MSTRSSPHPAIILALLASLSLCKASSYDRAHFGTTLRQKLAGKTGTAACRAAGAVLKSALVSKANRRHAPSYLLRLLSDLRPILPENAQTPARVYLAKTFVHSYFRSTTADPNDPTFLASARTLILRKMPISQQTESNFISISRPFYRYFHRSFRPGDGWIFYPSDFPNL